MSPEVAYALKLTAFGMGIVFTVLATIAAIVALMRSVDERWQRNERKKDEERTGYAPTIDATTLVIISAAVATYVGGRAHIKSVRPLRGPARSWAQQGRARVQGSHVVRRKR